MLLITQLLITWALTAIIHSAYASLGVGSGLLDEKLKMTLFLLRVSLPVFLSASFAFYIAYSLESENNQNAFRTTLKIICISDLVFIQVSHY